MAERFIIGLHFVFNLVFRKDFFSSYRLWVWLHKTSFLMMDFEFAKNSFNIHLEVWKMQHIGFQESLHLMDLVWHFCVNNPNYFVSGLYISFSLLGMGHLVFVLTTWLLLGYALTCFHDGASDTERSLVEELALLRKTSKDTALPTGKFALTLISL